ncbi:MAG TPA: extracellular solute-binding protein [Chloroflexi bacterium]|jgi:ABC-type glycerol-3-phosphate transport system substrate-binding protein|nr:extracellular solute-binding protein [Chloroflexota bacterium]
MMSKPPKRSLSFCVLALLLSGLILTGCLPGFLRPPTPDPVVLRFAYRQHTVEMDTLLDEFEEEYPWITVEAQAVQRYGDQIAGLVRNGQIDLFRDERSALSLAAQGLLRPLDDVQLGDWGDIRDDYFRGTWEGLRIRGQQFGVPAGTDTLVAYVNMNQVQALNVPLPDENWGMFDMLGLANALNYPEGLPGDATQRLFGFCTTPESMDPLVLIYLFGGSIVDDINAPTRATLDDPATVEAVRWYADLFQRYGVAPDRDRLRLAFPQGGVYEAATRGHCGLWLGWYSNRGGLDTPYRWVDSWYMLTLPREHTHLGLAEIEGYYITASSPHPEEALLLIRFLSERWEAAGQRIPPRRSMVQSAAYEHAVGANAAAVARELPAEMLVIPAELPPQLERIGELTMVAVNRVINEGLNAEDVLAEAQLQAEAALH